MAAPMKILWKHADRSLISYRFTVFRNKSNSEKYRGKKKEAHLKKTVNGHESAQPKNRFKEIQSERLSQAYRSVLFHIKPNKTEPHSVLGICSSFGVIQNAIKFNRGSGYLLVEFQQKEDVRKLLNDVSCFEEDNNLLYFPFKTRFLYKTASSWNRATKDRRFPIQLAEADNFDIHKLTYEKLDLSNGMKLLHDAHQITELETRLHYFVASTIEEMVARLFPNVRVGLFGSCVNGLGNTGCDLDLVLNFDLDTHSQGWSDLPLKFKAGNGERDIKSLSKRVLEAVGDLVSLCLPLVNGRVQKILKARVPIVKFNHYAASIDCDICVNNWSGEKMAELLFTFGELCPQIRPLVTVLKQWAQVEYLVQKNSTLGLSNFMLIIMSVFYLQSISLLPTLKHMQKLAGPSDRFVVDDIDYSFCTDLNKLKQSSEDPDLGDLLKGFFSFYSTFDFENTALSVIEGKPVKKISDDPMCIENPVEIDHNISRNVTESQLAKLLLSIQNSNELLEQSDRNSVLSNLLLNSRNNRVISDFNISNLFSKNGNSDNKISKHDSKNNGNDIENDMELDDDDLQEKVT